MPKQVRNAQQAEERLSQLIRLKRSEKPDAAFWQKFDEELHSRQLAAIVGRQTRLHRLSRQLISLSRKAALPSAAAAILALASYHTVNLSFVAEDQPGQTLETINADVAAAQPETPRFDVAADSEDPFSFDGPAIYGVNVLANTAPPSHYVLEAAPMTFTSQQTENPGAQLGAKIIRSSRQF